MATQPTPGQSPSRQRSWRLPIAMAVLVVLLVAYIAGVAWFSSRLGDDIQAGMQQSPVVEDVHHRAD